MRGASALQRVLEEAASRALTVIVVWEPVLPTDRFAPTTSVLARIADRRVRQTWDRERLVSTALGPALGHEPGDIVWDFVAVYPPGARWDEKLAAPAWSGAPVVDAAGELAAQLNERPAAPAPSVP